MSDSGLFVHDDLLGHVPNPGFSGSGFGRSFHTIGSDGLRFCGDIETPHEGTILAVGDSFTYGDEVTDEETWPAQLQALTGRRVLNGGVTGYGFDQIVLRAEQLVAAHRPAILVVSFIADDIRRAEMCRIWWRNKPWFAIDNDELVLEGVPVADRTRLPPRLRRRMDTALLHMPVILQHLFGYHRRVHRAGLGQEIARRLVGRLASLQTGPGLKIILMAQYPPDTWTNKAYLDLQRRLVPALLACAATHGIATVDTFSRLAAEPEPRGFYAHAHMTPRGNFTIASLLAARLPALLGQE